MSLLYNSRLFQISKKNEEKDFSNSKNVYGNVKLENFIFNSTKLCRNCFFRTEWKNNDFQNQTLLKKKKISQKSKQQTKLKQILNQHNLPLIDKLLFKYQSFPGCRRFSNILYQNHLQRNNNDNRKKASCSLIKIKLILNDSTPEKMYTHLIKKLENLPSDKLRQSHNEWKLRGKTGNKRKILISNNYSKGKRAKVNQIYKNFSKKNKRVNSLNEKVNADQFVENSLRPPINDISEICAWKI